MSSFQVDKKKSSSWITFSPVYSADLARLLLTVLIALIYGAAFFQRGKIESPMTLASVQNVSGLIFSMALFLGIFNCMAVMPLYFNERIVFYRERSASMYAPGPYTLATLVAEVPYLIIQAVIMVSISYWMVRGVLMMWFGSSTIAVSKGNSSNATFLFPISSGRTASQCMVRGCTIEHCQTRYITLHNYIHDWFFCCAGSSSISFCCFCSIW